MVNGLSGRAGPEPAGEVALEGVSKRFGPVEAVRDLTLEIHAGEFFSLLGPSGCGKSTTLRLIAGFEEPTTGRIVLGGKDVTRTAPHKRPVNTVFQSYALFPHLKVRDNVAFGLRFHDVSKAEGRRRVAETLALVRLEGLENRRPSQLSGGQQQRVALARALVLEPSVLLLDEPLGALDAKLRRALQLELKSIQEAVGITFIYVTHDQEEALTMSDRLAVMSEGLILQLGTPKEVYEEPATTFVADFLGVSNLMSAQAVGGGAVRLHEAELVAGRGDLRATGDVRLTIRPERVSLEPPSANGENRLPGVVERVVYLGPITQVIVRLAEGPTVQAMTSSGDSGASFQEGSPVTVVLPRDALRVLPG
ncbi:MAG: ABC transporter ATP-binding protein [Actinomycetota bacterium]|nr:ABC transporter ATP-binding protein [Actinomycetota bacterium]